MAAGFLRLSPHRIVSVPGGRKPHQLGRAIHTGKPSIVKQYLVGVRNAAVGWTNVGRALPFESLAKLGTFANVQFLRCKPQL